MNSEKTNPTPPMRLVDNYARLRTRANEARALMEQVILHDDATPEDLDRVVQLYRNIGRRLRTMYPSIQQYIHEYGRRRGVHSTLAAERRLEGIGRP